MADRPATRADVTQAAAGCLNLVGVVLGLGGVIAGDALHLATGMVLVVLGTAFLIVGARQRRCPTRRLCYE